MHLAAALDRYLAQLAADGRSPHTVQSARRHIGLLVRWAADGHAPTDIADLSHEDVARFLISPALTRTADGRPRKATSANTARTAIRVFFRYATDAGYAPTNAARLVRLARTGAPPPRTLAEDEVRRLVAAAEDADTDAGRRDGALIRLIAGTGLRITSALALRVQDLDLERGEMRVLQVKGGQPLVLPVSRQVVRELKAYLRTIPDDRGGLLFPGRAGQPLGRRQAARRIAVAAQAAGLGGRAVAHALRHSFATGLYRRTGDILVVQAALGHASVESSAIYARVDRAGLRAALRG
jgi:integrase/recombinase XerC